MRILYLDVDSLRPDHLGCYGYSRPTSPTVDHLAAQGVKFSRFYASDSPCVPSRAACFSGRPGICNGVIAHENTPAGCSFRYGSADRHGAAPLLAHHLADAGMHTVSFTSFADRHLAGWFTLGFREFHLPSLKGGNEDADEVNAAVLPWLRQHAKRDGWFLHLNYWDPHTLYTEPVEYMHRIAAHPAPTWPDEAAIERHRHLTGIRTAATLWGDNPHDGFGKSRVPTMPDEIRTRADVEHLVNGYDGGIRYFDDHLAEVLAELDRQGVLNDTAIIVSADHGEAFGELGQYMEHGSVSPATHHIPLIIRWPGITDAAAGSTCDQLLLNTDLAPTLADALGLKIPPGWTGSSFLSSLQQSCATSMSRTHLVWTHGLHTRQRAVFDGRWLFIRTYDPSWYLYPPRMLFDLLNDPHQEHDCFSCEAERAAGMERALRQWEHEHVEATALPDPMRLAQSQPPKSAAAIEHYIAQLQANGRAEAGQRLRDQSRSVCANDYAPDDL